MASATTGASFTAVTVTTKVFVTDRLPSVALTLIRLFPLPFAANARVRFAPCVIVAMTSDAFVLPTTA